MILGREEAQNLIAIIDKIIDKQEITDQHVDIAHGILSILGAKEEGLEYSFSSWPSENILSQVSESEQKVDLDVAAKLESSSGGQLAAANTTEAVTRIPFTKRVKLK